MSSAAKWGKESTSARKEIRGEVRDPKEPNLSVTIILRASRGKLDPTWKWAFEEFGSGSLSARSNHTYASASAAKEAAEHMAHAILALAKRLA